MIFAVFDTNVLASAAIASAGPLAALIEAWRLGRVRVVVSSHILNELERALGNAYFMTRLDAQRRDAFLGFARTTTTIVVITAPISNVASTHADNLVLATAESAGVSYLVTGDMELLRLGQYKTTRILSPRQFMEMLESETFVEG